MKEHWALCDDTDQITDAQIQATRIFGKHAVNDDALFIGGCLNILACRLTALTEEIADLKNLLAAVSGFEQAS